MMININKSQKKNRKELKIKQNNWKKKYNNNML